MREAVDFESFPRPACSHSDSTSRIDRPRTKAPITIALSGSVRSSFVRRGNSLETNGSAAARTCGISTSSCPSAVCTQRGRKPLRSPGGASGRRSYRASNSSSTARWMISRAPSRASSDSASRGFSPTPTASNRSICSSSSAEGGTVRLTA